MCYSDSDFAQECPSRKSTSGFVVMLNGTPLVLKSTTQRLTAQSTAEAEYVALAAAVREIKFLAKVVSDVYGLDFVHRENDFELVCKKPFSTRVDNQAALYICQNPLASLRTKHFEVRARFIFECIEAGWTRLSCAA